MHAGEQTECRTAGNCQLGVDTGAEMEDSLPWDREKGRNPGTTAGLGEGAQARRQKAKRKTA